jgi:hypothetical protein
MNNIPNNMKAAEDAYKKDMLMSDMRLQGTENAYKTGFNRGVRYIAETLEQIKSTDVKSIRMHDLIKELQKILNDAM